MNSEIEITDATDRIERNRLKLDAAFNFRDLGGYETKDGRRTRPGVLFRSDDLWRLTDNDLDQLRGLSIKTVIDLRTESEASTRGRFPADKLEVQYHHISLADISADNSKAIGNPHYLEDRYREILVSSPQNVAAVINLIAETSASPIVFHCAVGKDRTGLVAALTLGLLGVDDETIIYDYSASQPAMDKTIEWLRDEQPEIAAALEQLPPIILSAPASAMAATLEWLKSEFGGYHSYAEFAGITQSTIATLQTNYLSGPNEDA